MIYSNLQTIKGATTNPRFDSGSSHSPSVYAARRVFESQKSAECDKQCDNVSLFSAMFVDVFCRFFAVHQRQLSSGFAPNPPLAQILGHRANPNPRPKSSPGVLPKVSLAAQILGAPFSKPRGFRGGVAASFSPRGSASLAGAKGVRGER
jgi:hypothetical protein